MTKTLDEVTTELDLTEIRVEVGFPDTPFGGVQAFGIGDTPIQVVFGNEPGEESPETPTPPTGEGIPGPQGPPGPKGDPGEPGPPGPAGDDGAAGAAGPQGIQGEPGAEGATGGQGVPGAAGPQGVQGATGPAGPKGTDGTSVVIKGSVANAAALPPTGNTLGDLYITLDTGHGWVWGSPGQWSDVGPIQGPPGATGAAGAVGAQGPAGATGPQGAKGDVGSMGPQGAQGVQGLKGDTGAKGNTGATGATGAQGIPGATGATGPQGNQGPVGNTGPQGVKGDPGATGATGAAGTNGATGATGPGVAAGGALGAILRKKTATDFDTEWKPLATLQTASNLTAVIAGSNPKHCGFGATAKITPTASGKVIVRAIIGIFYTVPTGSYLTIGAGRYGTGAAPGLNAVPTGTAFGNLIQTPSATVTGQVTYAEVTAILNLTPGTQYWFDIILNCNDAGATGNANAAQVIAYELP